MRKSFRFPLAVAFATSIGMAGGLAAAAFPQSAVAAEAAPEAGTEPLTIVTASGPHRFAVEVMRSEAQRERGLMFRHYLPADRGMLFDFASPQTVMMWMKNTYIPLDMIFIGASGRVASIVTNTEPLSEHIITSGVPVDAVLEVNAGTAEKIGLKVGDRVQNALFAK